jgi:hypothetical protein
MATKMHEQHRAGEDPLILPQRNLKTTKMELHTKEEKVKSRHTLLNAGAREK